MSLSRSDRRAIAASACNGSRSRTHCCANAADQSEVTIISFGAICKRPTVCGELVFERRDWPDLPSALGDVVKIARHLRALRSRWWQIFRLLRATMILCADSSSRSATALSFRLPRWTETFPIGAPSPYVSPNAVCNRSITGSAGAPQCPYTCARQREVLLGRRRRN